MGYDEHTIDSHPRFVPRAARNCIVSYAGTHEKVSLHVSSCTHTHGDPYQNRIISSKDSAFSRGLTWGSLSSFDNHGNALYPHYWIPCSAACNKHQDIPCNKHIDASDYEGRQNGDNDAHKAFKAEKEDCKYQTGWLQVSHGGTECCQWRDMIPLIVTKCKPVKDWYRDWNHGRVEAACWKSSSSSMWCITKPKPRWNPSTKYGKLVYIHMSNDHKRETKGSYIIIMEYERE